MKVNKILSKVHFFLAIYLLNIVFNLAFGQTTADPSANISTTVKAPNPQPSSSNPDANDNYLELELDTPSDYDAAQKQNNKASDNNSSSEYDEIEKIESKDNLVPAKTNTDKTKTAAPTTTTTTTNNNTSIDPNVIAPSKTAITNSTSTTAIAPKTNTVPNAATTTTTTAAVNKTTNANAPLLKPDNVTTKEDSSIIIRGSYLLSNDSDADGGKLTIISVKPPKNGRAVLIGHNIIYSPNSNFHGLDPIHYTVSDSSGKTSEGLVNINVTSVNDTPDVSPILDQEVKPGEEIKLKSGKYFDDEEGSKLDYSATGLPPGLSIDNNGFISGKIAPDAKGGEYHVTVYAADPSGATATNEFTYLVVTPSVDTTLYSDSETKSLITTAPAGEDVTNTDPQVNRTPDTDNGNGSNNQSTNTSSATTPSAPTATPTATTPAAPNTTSTATTPAAVPKSSPNS